MEELQLNRRRFIKNTLTGAIVLGLDFSVLDVFAKEDFTKLTILHTNDVHSRIEPFPMDGTKYQGKGGVAARTALIKKIRAEEENVLLFDAGDIFQGTPYFNYWGGELELKLMSMMGYDAAIMGNHDFDNGVGGFAKHLPHINFPILNANYNFTDTELEKKTKSYHIFKKDNIKIGVYGLGIDLIGLVNQEQYGNTKYIDALAKALEMERFLKLDQKCDLVICLSHLGYRYQTNKISDVLIAQNTYFTDLIIGGHTHTFLPKPDSIRNLSGTETLVNQVGFAGINLGRIDFVFSRKKQKKVLYSSAIEVVDNNFKI